MKTNRMIPQVRRSNALFVAAFLAAIVASAHCEIVGSLFTGFSLTQDNDLRLQQAGGTDLTFHEVSYKSRDFESPIYYGGRLAYFLSRQSHWGFGAEFFHVKMYLNSADTVHVTGTRAGVPVNGSERINQSLESFSISHGLNFLTADAIYRFFPGERDQDFLGRFQPYLGAGIGAVIPHVEVTLPGQPHFEEYQWHGPGVQAFAGTNFDLFKHLSLFVEYKFTYANLDHLNFPGGSISVDALTHHFVTGISVLF